MYLTSEKKAELFAKYGNDAKNTGSAESQIALFTFRINHLTEHLKKNHKDFGTERALTMLVGKRRRLLDYFTLMGLIAGSTTDPPALAYATTVSASNDRAAVAYSTVYPLTMFLRVLTGQLMILLFL